MKGGTAMKEMLSSVSPKGQVTIPLEIRQMFGIKPKDKVAFKVENGKVQITPAKYTLESVMGSVEPATRTEDFERISAEAKEEHVERTMAKLEQRP
jgi:AbrB family looped-hinge helix DNA binding protein